MHLDKYLASWRVSSKFISDIRDGINETDNVHSILVGINYFHLRCCGPVGHSGVCGELGYRFFVFMAVINSQYSLLEDSWKLWGGVTCPYVCPKQAV